MFNCIVAGNSAPTGPDIFNYGITIRYGGNIIPQFTNAVGENGSDSGPTPITNSPLLAPLGSYGGPTQTMPPLAGSPAIDTGSDAVLGFLATDQRGHLRKSGAHVDIGAVEVDTNSIVTVNTDNGLAGSLRYAVAHVQTGDLISFDTNLSGSIIVLTGGQIVLTNNVSIDGSGLAGGIQISGNHTSRAFSMGSNTTDTLTALTITKGVAANPNYGGGVINYVSGSVLTLNRCTVTGNYASGSAGGLYSVGTTFVNECTFTGNSSGNGGGGGIYNDGTMTISQSTVSGNTSTTTSAGGGVATFFGSLAMNSSIAAGNSAPSGQQLSYGTFTGINNITNGNPLLAPLGNYGGPTQTMPPLAGSPAINAGGSTSFTTDQRGYPRVSSTGVDIGAVEVQVASGPFVLNGINGITRAVELANGRAQINFTNLAGGSFTIFATTNVAAPLNTWANLGTALESPAGSGLFQFTDITATNFTRRFYRVTSP